MFKLSVYGKGGIGKSTLSSNISYGLSRKGLKVLHVGCDPKHDSTRLLTNGVLQKTFLDFLNDHDPEGIMETGSGDITCVECGGATPGIGCAGKGMMRLFDYLDEHLPDDIDVRINDVLGDVVCGGFSVPMRRENCDALVIVTSEEFMSLYAANGILRGMENINGEKRLLGMIVNSREPTMAESVRIFSEATGTRILGRISRSSAFAEAEANGRTVLEQFPESESAREIEAVLDEVMKAYDGEDVCTFPHPLTDRQMYDIAAGRPIGSLNADSPEEEEKEVKEFEEVDHERGVKYLRDFAVPACTSHGAGELLMGISDAAVVYNGPDNCAFLTEYAHRRRYLKVAGRVGPFSNCNLYSAGMDDAAAFSGSYDGLRRAVRQAVDDGFRTVFLVSTCSSSIIGADLKKEAENLSGNGVNVIAVPEDSKFLGGKFGNFSGAVSVLSDMMDWDQQPIPDTINIIGFSTAGMEREFNREYTELLLGLMGLRVNTYFMGVTDIKTIKKVPLAQYNLVMGDQGLDGIMVRKLLDGRRGYISTEGYTGKLDAHEFLDSLAEMTGRKGQAEDAKRTIDRMYDDAVAGIRKDTEGKTALIFGRNLYRMDRFVNMLESIGMTVPCIALRKKDMIIDRPDPEIPGSDIIEDISFCELKGIIDRYKPDIVLSMDPRVGTLGCRWASMGMSGSGVHGVALWADKIRNCMKLPNEEEWRCEL